MAKSLLPASVELRLKAHTELWHRLSQGEGRPPARVAPFITLSRQYGCAAYALAERLAQCLKADFPEWDFAIYDRQVLEALLEREPVTADMINSLSRRARGPIADWADDVIAGRPSELRVFRHLAKTLCSIAALGQAILIGRGGAVITRKIATGIHVRLVAPLEWRIESLKTYPDRAGEATEEMVRQADREREGFVRRFLGVDVNDPAFYHLTLNNQLLTQEEQAQTIANLVGARCRATDPVGAHGGAD